MESLGLGNYDRLRHAYAHTALDTAVNNVEATAKSSEAAAETKDVDEPDGMQPLCGLARVVSNRQ